jgi:transcriptional regulator with XRE-family HTH domain
MARHALWFARNRRGLTLQRLAERSGLSIGGISRIETCDIVNPHPLTRAALARALNYRVSDIWPGPNAEVHPDLRPSKAHRRRNRAGTPTKPARKP